MKNLGELNWLFKTCATGESPAPLDELCERAKSGDETAAGMLFTLACEATDRLRDVAFNNPKALLPFTRAIALFPAMICKTGGKDQEHAKLLKVCEVGMESRLNADSPAAMRFDPVKRETAKWYAWMNMIRDGEQSHPDQAITDKCRRLPEPNRDTFKEWNSVMQEMIPGVDKFADFPTDLWTVAMSGMKPGRRVSEIKKQMSQSLFTILPDAKVG